MGEDGAYFVELEVDDKVMASYIVLASGREEVLRKLNEAVGADNLLCDKMTLQFLPGEVIQ